MLYYSSILKDSPVGFWKLDEISGSTSYDFSGCGNNGSYVGNINRVQIPLVPGGIHANKITNTQTISFPITRDMSGQTGIGGFGIQKTEDNSFSFEIWFHPKNITSLTPIFADEDGIGIYWDKGNIVFKLESERIDYCTQYQNKSFYVVAVYEPNVIKLYVDGELVVSKNISGLTFSNQSLTVKSGPANVNESFLIDAPAIYRYALNLNQVRTHYQHVDDNTNVQVVQSNFGQLFKSTLQHQFPPDNFTWPAYIPFKIFEDDNIKYKKATDSLYLVGASGSYLITSILPLPHKEYVSSKIEWIGTKGIKVYSSIDNEVSWQECINGSSIPGISLGTNYVNNKQIYFKVEFNTDDINYYIPELDYMGVYLYPEKKIYSHNGRSFISVSQPSTGSSWDLDFSNREDQILSRNYDNGIRSRGSGFYLETVDNILTVETVFVPESLSTGYLFYNKTAGTEYSVSWASDGTLTKLNIAGLYINGQDASSITNISNYLNIGEPNYIMIKTSNSITGQIWFNCKSDNNVRSGILPDNLYNIISIYENSTPNHLTNYNAYIGNEVISANNSVFTLTDIGPSAYDFDWVTLDNA